MLTSTKTKLRLVCAALATVAVAPAQGKLWIVSDTGCPLVHSAEIQPAVDAAADGDVILIRPRTRPPYLYADFTIDGKALTILHDRLGYVSMGGVTVRNLASGQGVVLHGVSGSFLRSVDLQDNAGPVWIQDWRMNAKGVPLRIENSRSVVISRLDLRSSDSLAAHFSNSGVYLYDAVVRGGSPGQTAIRVDGGTLLASGGSVVGGTGEGLQWYAPVCPTTGPGGNGIEHGQNAAIYLAGAIVRGGAGGRSSYSWFTSSGFTTVSCASGSPGSAFVGPANRRLDFQTGAHSMRSASPVLEGGSLPTEFRGIGSEQIGLLLSARQGHRFLPGAAGALVAAAPATPLWLGGADPSGYLAQDFSVPRGLVAPGMALVLHTQSMFLDPSARLFAGAPYAWIVLDENHDPRDGCP